MVLSHLPKVGSSRSHACLHLFFIILASCRWRKSQIQSHWLNPRAYSKSNINVHLETPSLQEVCEERNMVEARLEGNTARAFRVWKLNPRPEEGSRDDCSGSGRAWAGGVGKGGELWGLRPREGSWRGSALDFVYEESELKFYKNEICLPFSSLHFTVPRKFFF